MSYCFGLDFLLLITLTVASSCFRAGTAKEVTELPNEDCRPRPTLIAIGSPSFLFFPYYVTLHRCSGSIGYISPVAKTCVPDTTQVVRIRVNNLIRGGKQVLTKNNHTSCKPECTDKKEMCDEELEEWNEATCSCECKYPSGPPVPCPARFKWNEHICRCECNVEKYATECLRQRKVWSADKCGCDCPARVIIKCKIRKQVLDEENCRCLDREVVHGAQSGNDDNTGVSKPMLFGIVFGELLLLVFIFDLILYLKKWGFIYYLRKSIGKAISREKQERAPPLSPSVNHERTTYL